VLTAIIGLAVAGLAVGAIAYFWDTFMYFLYNIWTMLAYVVNVLESMFRMLAGVRGHGVQSGGNEHFHGTDPGNSPNVDPGGNLGGDGTIGTDIVSRIIGDRLVQQIFANLIIEKHVVFSTPCGKISETDGFQHKIE
jgi:hypothetical protein